MTELDEQNGTRARKMMTRSKILPVDIIEWPAEDRWLKHSSKRSLNSGVLRWLPKTVSTGDKSRHDEAANSTFKTRWKRSLRQLSNLATELQGMLASRSVAAIFCSKIERKRGIGRDISLRSSSSMLSPQRHLVKAQSLC